MTSTFLSQPILFLIAALLSFVIILFLLKTGLAWKLATDIPNQRSMHTRPTPRIGGWGFVLTCIIFSAWSADMRGLLIPFLLLAAISFLDDHLNLPSSIRFIVHLLCAGLLLWQTGQAFPLWLIAILIIATAWMTNLYNFMDGADGLAGGMALIGFGAYAIAAAHSSFTIWPTVLSGAALGFLFLNFHPAKTFMGDVGSIPLGFMAAALGLVGYTQGLWAAWFPLVVFSPFIADASVTLGRRLLRGEKFWQAHREHYYQRMIRMSGRHRSTVLAWYIYMALAAILALSLSNCSLLCTTITIVIWFLALLLAGLRIDRQWRVYLDQQNP